MEQADFEKEMKKIDAIKKSEMRKKIFIICGIVLTLVAILNISSYINRNKIENETFATDKKDFIEDSIWLVNVLSKHNPDQLNTDVLFSLDKGFKYNRYGSEKSRENLLNILNAIRVRTDTGTRILDEFDRVSVVKNNTKSVILNIGDLNKYEVKRIYKGFANASNRKAFKLKEKYPSWSTNDCITVSSRHIRIGMTPDMVREAWGRPEDINRTVGSWGVHEQWVYGYNYVYFEDGICTSYQN